MPVKALANKSQRAQLHLKQLELPVRNLHVSYGTTGQPTLWARGDAQLAESVLLYGDILTKTFGIKPEEKTLVIIGFFMSGWIAGNYSVLAFHEMTYRQGFNLTLYPCGGDSQRILPYMQEFADTFDNIVLLGPPAVIHRWVEASTILRHTQARIFTITSAMRTSMLWKHNIIEYLNDSALNHHVNLYGCADAGIVAYETRLSMSLIELMQQHKALQAFLLGELDQDTPFSLMQFNADILQITSENNEICISAQQHVIPLQHYRTGDQGRPIAVSAVRDFCQQHGLLTEPLTALFGSFDQPFLVMQGRYAVALRYLHETRPYTLRPAIFEDVIQALSVNIKSLQDAFLYYIKKIDNKLTVFVEIESLPVGDNEVLEIERQFIQVLCHLNRHIATDINSGEFVVTVKLIHAGAFAQRCDALKQQDVQFVYKAYADKARVY